MRLDVYLKIHEISQIQMAKKLGITKAYMHELSSRKKSPSRVMAKKIEEITKGEVTRLELLYPEEFTTRWYFWWLFFV